MDNQVIVPILVGAQTVVFTVTLIFLIRQNRQLAKSLRTATYMDVVARGNALFERAIDFPQSLGPIMFGALPVAEQTEQAYLKSAYVLALLNLFHWVYLQYSQKNIDEDSWQRWKALLCLIAGRPEVKKFWQSLEIREKRYASQFVTIIDEFTGTTAAG